MPSHEQNLWRFSWLILMWIRLVYYFKTRCDPTLVWSAIRSFVRKRRITYQNYRALIIIERFSEKPYVPMPFLCRTSFSDNRRTKHTHTNGKVHQIALKMPVSPSVFMCWLFYFCCAVLSFVLHVRLFGPCEISHQSIRINALQNGASWKCRHLVVVSSRIRYIDIVSILIPLGTVHFFVPQLSRFLPVVSWACGFWGKIGFVHFAATLLCGIWQECAPNKDMGLGSFHSLCVTFLYLFFSFSSSQR